MTTAITGFPTEALPDVPPAALGATAEADGALLLRGLLDAELVDRVRTVALDAAHETGWLHPDHPPSAGISRPGLAIGAYDDAWLEVQRAVVSDSSWDALGTTPPLHRALEAILGTPPEGGHGSVLRAFSTAGEPYTTPPHQERAFIGGRPNAWTAWIPLGECPRELGGLAVMRGSHRRGPLPHAGDHCTRVPEGQPWACGDYEPGDVLLVHCHTLHRALPNRDPAGRLRLSADFRFRPRAPSS